MLVTPHKYSPLTLVNNQHKDVHGKSFIIWNKNKGLGENMFWTICKAYRKRPKSEPQVGRCTKQLDPRFGPKVDKSTL